MKSAIIAHRGPAWLLLCLALLGCQPSEHGGVDKSGLKPVGALSTASSSPIPPGAQRSPSHRSDPVLSLSWGDQSRALSRSELLASPLIKTLTIPAPADLPGEQLTFQAIPIHSLLSQVSFGEDQRVEYKCLDGFSANLDPGLLLNSDPARSVAYLAIEDPSAPWPKMLKNGQSAGPFFLIWENPGLSKIGQEQWPFQLTSLAVQDKDEARFPAIAPANDLPADHPVRLGYASFMKNCFACHTLNRQGSSNLGPDLNFPHSPTEYMHEEYIRQLVRNPQALRHWKGSRMSAFDQSDLSELELDHIIAFLEHKAEQRRKAAQAAK